MEVIPFVEIERTTKSACLILIHTSHCNVGVSPCPYHTKVFIIHYENNCTVSYRSYGVLGRHLVMYDGPINRHLGNTKRIYRAKLLLLVFLSDTKLKMQSSRNVLKFEIHETFHGNFLTENLCVYIRKYFC